MKKRKTPTLNKDNIRVTLTELIQSAELDFYGYILTVDKLRGEMWYENSFGFTEQEFDELKPHQLVHIINSMIKKVCRKNI